MKLQNAHTSASLTLCFLKDAGICTHRCALSHEQMCVPTRRLLPAVEKAEPLGADVDVVQVEVFERVLSGANHLAQLSDVVPDEGWVFRVLRLLYLPCTYAYKSAAE